MLRTKFGLVIVMDDHEGSEKILIRAKNGCEITLDPHADQITVKAGTVVVQDSGQNVQELATKSFVMNVFDQHTHGSGTGPTSTPIPLPPPLLPALTSTLKAE